MIKNNEGILAIDIGGNQIAGVVGVCEESNRLQILGTGTNNNPTGFKKGHIVDFEQAITDFKQTIARVCYASNASITHMLINVNTYTVQEPFPSEGILFPHQLGDPGFSSLISFQLLADRFNIELLGFIPDVFAVAQVIVKQKEKEDGVLVLDAGWDTIHGVLYQPDQLPFLFDIPIGGRYITQDLAYGLKISPREAESIKIKYSTESDGADIPFPVDFIQMIIHARLKEVFQMIGDKLSDIPKTYPIIATGGMSKTHGFSEIGTHILGNTMTLRYFPVADCHLIIGAPWEIVPVGMLAYALTSPHIKASLHLDSPATDSRKMISPIKIQPNKKNFFQDVKSVFDEFF